MVRTTNGFDKENQAEFMMTMDTIISNMNSNPNFPQQKPLVDQLIAERPLYSDLVQAAANGKVTHRPKALSYLPIFNLAKTI